MKPKIMVIGSYAVGMTMKTKRMPKQGETVMGQNFVQIAGGKGSNQAIAAARLGADVMFYTCLGNDQMGDNALKMYASEGIDASLIKRSKTFSTGVGFVIVDDSGNNSIVIDLGANLDISPADIEAIEPHINNCGFLLLQNEVNLDAVKKAIIVAKQNGVKIIYDPAPYAPIPDKYLSMVDILTPNEHEATMLIGADKRTSPDQLAQALEAKGIDTVIITLGGSGCLVRKEGHSTVYPAPKVEVVDSTGAGDTFSGALAVSLSEGASIDNAVTFACRAASISVTRYGVVESIPYRTQLK